MKTFFLGGATLLSTVALLGLSHADTSALQVSVVPSKLAYKNGETASVTVKIVNSGGSSFNGPLALSAISGLDVAQSVGTQNVSVAANGTATATFSATANGGEGGREFRATFSPSGQTPVVGREFSLVTDNLVRFSHLLFVGASNAEDWTKTEAKHTSDALEIVGVARSQYFGILERIYWALDEYGQQESTDPSAQTWRAGQNFDFFVKPQLTALLRESKNQGLLRLFYANTFAFGPDGFESARQNPELFFWGKNWYGGTFSVGNFKKWKDPRALRPDPNGADRAIHEFTPDPLYAITPILTNPAAVKLHTDAVIQSAQNLGWDGIRYDNAGWGLGHETQFDSFGNALYPPGTNRDQLEAQLVTQARQTYENAIPGFIYGNNGGGIAPPNNPAFPVLKWQAEAANNGLVMEEAFSSRIKENRPFDFYRTYLHKGCKEVRALGGLPYIIGPAGISPTAVSLPDIKTLAAFTLSSGGQLCSGGAGAPHLTPYLALTARYGELLYDANLTWLDNVDTYFTVNSPDVWWREYARRRTNAQGNTQYLIHLHNKPTRTNFGTGSDAPVTRSNVAVGFKVPSGKTVSKVAYITADGGSVQTQTLTPAVSNGTATVTVPSLSQWTIVVFETVNSGA